MKLRTIALLLCSLSLIAWESQAAESSLGKAAEQLLSKNGAEQKAGAETLVSAGKEALPFVLQMMEENADSPNAYKGSFVLETILDKPQHRNAETLTLIFSFLKRTKDKPVEEIGLQALRRFEPTPEFLGYLSDRLANGKSPGLRNQALAQYARRATDKKAVEAAARHALNDSSDEVRIRAAGILAERGIPEGESRLIEFLERPGSDQKTIVQKGLAADALRDSGTARALPALKRLTEKPVRQQWFAQSSAMVAIKAIEYRALQTSEARLDHLAKAMKDRPTRAWAIKALAKEGSEGARRILTDASKDPRNPARIDAARALRSLNDKGMGADR